MVHWWVLVQCGIPMRCLEEWNACSVEMPALFFNGAGIPFLQNAPPTMKVKIC
jgi:hypothetical protein